MRLNELLSIKESHIDWDSRTVVIWGKGGTQRKAPFTKRTAELMGEHLRVNEINGNVNVWGIRRRGVQIMLYRLERRTGLPCNPHMFRRTFAFNLRRAGLDVEHIMRLGGRESLDMVLRYTRSVKREESLRLYRGLEKA
jgi:integrase